MKQKFYLIVMIIIAGLCNVQETSAQQIDTNTGMVVWEGATLAQAVDSCQAGRYVYLCQFQSSLGTAANPVREKFINSGGAYGVQGVLSNIGMRVQITKNGNNYQITTRVQNSGNKGDRIGFDDTRDRQYGQGIEVYHGGNKIYLDRSSTDAQKNRVNWTVHEFETKDKKSNIKYERDATSEDKQIQTYAIRCTSNTDYYIGVDNSGNLEVSQIPVHWIIVNEYDYKKAMDNVTWGEVDLGSFVQDADFGRDNKDARYWVWGDAEKVDGITQDDYSSSEHWHQRNQDKMCNGKVFGTMGKGEIGNNLPNPNNRPTNYKWNNEAFVQDYAQYFAAEIYKEVNSLTQEIHMTNVENLTSGLYKLTAQALYYDDIDGLTNDGVAYFVVKTETNGVTTTDRLPIIPMNKVERNNITPHSGVSAGYVFDTNSNAYVLDFFVELTKESKLTIGIETTKAEGWTVIGNVHLYAHGKQIVFVDEDWAETETLTYNDVTGLVTVTDNPYKTIGFYDNNYTYPVTVHYQRTFTLNGWNTICLPVPLTGSQVRQSFGENTKLSELRIVDGNILRFHSVDLDVEGLKAGKPYIIKPTRMPDVAAGNSDTLIVGNGGKNHTVVMEGPVYYIPGVQKVQFSTDKDGNPTLWNIENYTSDPTSDAGVVTFEGTYYKKTLTANSDEYANNDIWVITQGNMYHLTGKKDFTVWATYCYLHAPKETSAGAKSMRIMVDDEEVMTTAIEGLMIDYGPAINDNKVYTLNGQRVGGVESLDALPKGVYIVNGKKYVVK